MSRTDITGSPHVTDTPDLPDGVPATCAWCDASLTTDHDDPAGDFLVWQHHTGRTDAYCTIYHLLKGFDDEAGTDTASAL